ncbi:anhydro-N-acetylmuramic acid kinase [Ruania alba]|uniref:Anhydro-N-acetylmuramic acid kinase n=1 Tax=Ruania alba TaxID=648782 RepID=A0A1H5L3S1_9MICO|nr:anhydro-N-acetylmuramic acid kinase [Ruania alba]SEE71696.1 anhydro-N-acetylmuramic acid kinase [Ruania alba]
MRILGLISGTSHDGIDSAVVEFTPEDGGLRADVVARGATPYDEQLRAELVAALPPAPTTLADVTRLDTRIGQAFARAAADAIDQAGPVDLIVSHGQTVYHWVDDARVLGTAQIGQPAWIAEGTGAPVLSDVRIRDITAGGQGAPLASTLDSLVLAGRARAGGPRGRVAALNLGGISNVTVVGDGPPRAWDIGPANALIDAVVHAERLHPAGFDAGGAIAATGEVDTRLLEELLGEPYYAQVPPKSTGKELFHLDYVRDMVGRSGQTTHGADLVATLTALTVRTIADALHHEQLTELFVSGGGVHNRVLMDGLAAGLPGVAVQTTDVLGLGADEKEAVLMALLGWLTWHGVPASVPSATGASAPRLLGSLTPGAGPLRLPEPQSAPDFLRLGTVAREEGE